MRLFSQIDGSGLAASLLRPWNFVSLSQLYARVTLSCCSVAAELTCAAAAAGDRLLRQELVDVPASVCHSYFNPATPPVCAPPHHLRPNIFFLPCIHLEAPQSSASSLSPFRTLSDPALRMRQTCGFKSSSISCECRPPAATSQATVPATIALRAYVL